MKGFGNVGSFAARTFSEEGGCNIIGITEKECSLHNPDGIDIQKLIDYQALNKTIKGFPDAKEFSGDLILEKCDILIPAAMEKTINHSNADKIQAKV